MKHPLILAAATMLALSAMRVSAQAGNPLLVQQAQMTKMPAIGIQDKDYQPPGASIVGLWHTVYKTPDGQFFLEGYATWHRDGTEEEVANRPPASGPSPGMGVWTQTDRTINLLTFVAWLYDSNNNFIGTLDMNQTNKLKVHGDKYTGTFDAKFYDPQGNLVQEVTGTSAADRLN